MRGGLQRRVGRPRSEAIDAAILDATVDELIERGYIGLTIEAIAARAGVAKTTVYRRWSTIEDLGLAALRHIKGPLQTPPPGPARDRLLVLLEHIRRTWADPRYAALMRRAAADRNCRPDVYEYFRDRHVGPFETTMNEVLLQAVDEGLIRAGLELAWVRRALTSPIIAAALTNKRVSRGQVEFTLDTVLAGLRP